MDFLNGLWNYVANFEWWQGLIIIFVVLVTFFVGKFWRNVFEFIGISLTREGSAEQNETLQYRMFWGLSNDAINIKMKDELRRSFKENGFHELVGNDFNQYVKNQSKNLISIVRNHIINLYPSNSKGRGIIVSMEEILEEINKKEPFFEDLFFEVYTEAKKFMIQDNNSLNEIDKKFEEEINEFSKNKTSSDCGSCVTIMFGKKIIAENKKARFKTLKSQMNFSERKISELHSSLISYYSEKINEKKKRK